MEERQDRAEMFTALLKTGKLTCAHLSKPQDGGLEAALAIPHELAKSRALADLAPRLTGELLNDS